jgi:superfamily I DNA and RNA helicase
MDFIFTDPSGAPGERSEEKIWDKVKKAFAEREGYAYWRYPLFSEVLEKKGKKYREPDILIVDRELGLIIIEVKGCRIHQIKQINGQKWIMSEDFYDQEIRPVTQANNQMTDLLSYCDKQLELTDRVTSRLLIGLPEIKRKEWEAKFSNLPSAPPVLCNDELGASTLLEIVRNTIPRRPGNSLNERQWKLLLGVIAGHNDDGVPPWVSTEQDTPQEVDNRKEVFEKIQCRLYELDIQQEQLGKQIPPGPQQIRGIAGSGKTVVLAQRAAHMHLKHPEWDIAFIFFTRSLYEQIRREVNRWLQRFSNNRITLEDAEDKIKILHAWGAENKEGFYSLLRDKVRLSKNIDFLNQGSPTERLARLYRRILEYNSPLVPCFDAILIDEGQDLVVKEDLKFEGRQPIYWLAWQTLRPISLNEPHLRRLYWAYDEFQSLDAFVVPKYKELFGEDLANLLVGRGTKYKGNIDKYIVMRCSYRTPKEILLAAFAMGVGLLRPNGRLSRFTKEDLTDIGFTLEGDLRVKNSIIRISRNAENSKNPVTELWKKPLIEFETFENRQEEMKALTQKINEAKTSGFQLDKNLLVIALGNSQQVSTLQSWIVDALQKAQINFFIPGEKDDTQLSKDLFWMKDAVTVTNVYRAKGNEAYWVFITGLDNIKEDNSTLRNQLFVAMTRTKGWLSISGLKNQWTKTLYDEMRQAIENKGYIEFLNHVDNSFSVVDAVPASEN